MSKRNIALAKTSSTHTLSGKTVCENFLREAGKVIFNKDNELRLSLICFLAQGHLLIEDIPGVGKTTFVKTINKILGLKFGRVQFTNDLLPSDILGVSIYDSESKKFRFHKGPIFAEHVLIDELNRATPKTQSALLQAMEEKHISIDGETLHLPEPFFLIATQNPRYQVGTFSLPESQLDRFMMRIQLGYPGLAAEKTLLMGADVSARLASVDTIFTLKELLELQKHVASIHVSEDVATYVQNILENSRKQQKDVLGLSPRAGLSLIAAAKAAAFLEGRDAVYPEDVQIVAASVFNHRISNVNSTFQHANTLSEELLNSVEVE